MLARIARYCAAPTNSTPGKDEGDSSHVVLNRITPLLPLYENFPKMDGRISGTLVVPEGNSKIGHVMWTILVKSASTWEMR
jgi:hypothetical protein